MRILLVEDDEYLQSALALALRRNEYELETVSTGPEAKTAVASKSYDLILLDLGLPGADGIEVLEEVRAKGVDSAVIIITARDGLEDRIKGLDLGANDYLVKPFDFRELEARIRAALRQSHWQNQVEIHFGAITLNTNSGTLMIDGSSTELTPKESAVLKSLLTKPGRVVTKAQLMNQVARWADESTQNAVEIVVHRLRKKLESANVVIQTVRGFGYCLEEKRQ